MGSSWLPNVSVNNIASDCVKQVLDDRMFEVRSCHSLLLQRRRLMVAWKRPYETWMRCEVAKSRSLVAILGFSPSRPAPGRSKNGAILPVLIPIFEENRERSSHLLHKLDIDIRLWGC